MNIFELVRPYMYRTTFGFLFWLVLIITSLYCAIWFTARCAQEYVDSFESMDEINNLKFAVMFTGLFLLCQFIVMIFVLYAADYIGLE